MVVITLHRGPMMVQSYGVYRITGNFGGVDFCGIGLKRRHIIFANCFFLRIENGLYYRKQQQKR